MQHSSKDIKKIVSELEYYYGIKENKDRLEVALDGDSFIIVELEDEDIVSSYISSIECGCY